MAFAPLRPDVTYAGICLIGPMVEANGGDFPSVPETLPGWLGTD